MQPPFFEDKNNQYEFLEKIGSVSLSFIRYIHVICLVGWLICLGIDMSVGGTNNSSLRFPKFSFYLLLPIFFSSALLIYVVWRNQALKIIFNKKVFTIYKFFRKKPIMYQLAELEFVKINFISIVFKFNDGRVVSFYGQKPNEYYSFTRFIKKNNIPIKKGLWAKSRFDKYNGNKTIT